MPHPPWNKGNTVAIRAMLCVTQPTLMICTTLYASLTLFQELAASVAGVPGTNLSTTALLGAFTAAGSLLGASSQYFPLKVFLPSPTTLVLPLLALVVPGVFLLTTWGATHAQGIGALLLGTGLSKLCKVSSCTLIAYGTRRATMIALAAAMAVALIPAHVAGFSFITATLCLETLRPTSTRDEDPALTGGSVTMRSTSYGTSDITPLPHVISIAISLTCCFALYTQMVPSNQAHITGTATASLALVTLSLLSISIAAIHKSSSGTMLLGACLVTAVFVVSGTINNFSILLTYGYRACLLLCCAIALVPVDRQQVQKAPQQDRSALAPHLPLAIAISAALGSTTGDALVVPNRGILSPYIAAFIALGFIVLLGNTVNKTPRMKPRCDERRTLPRNICALLSPRELAVVLLVHNGTTKSQVSRKLGLARSTVSTYLTRAQQKLQLFARNGGTLATINSSTSPCDTALQASDGVSDAKVADSPPYSHRAWDMACSIAATYSAIAAFATITRMICAPARLEPLALRNTSAAESMALLSIMGAACTLCAIGVSVVRPSCTQPDSRRNANAKRNFYVLCLFLLLTLFVAWREQPSSQLASLLCWALVLTQQASGVWCALGTYRTAASCTHRPYSPFIWLCSLPFATMMFAVPGIIPAGISIAAVTTLLGTRTANTDTAAHVPQRRQANHLPPQQPAWLYEPILRHTSKRNAILILMTGLGALAHVGTQMLDADSPFHAYTLWALVTVAGTTCTAAIVAGTVSSDAPSSQREASCYGFALQTWTVGMLATSLLNEMGMPAIVRVVLTCSAVCFGAAFAAREQCVRGRCLRALKQSTYLADILAHEGLTPSELTIARLLCEDSSISVIAQRCFLSRETVKTHRRHIYAKLGVHSRDELRGRIGYLLVQRQRRRQSSDLARP